MVDTGMGHVGFRCVVRPSEEDPGGRSPATPTVIIS